MDNAIKTILKHGNAVGSLMLYFAYKLIDRATKHDHSKLTEPELSGFNEYFKLIKRVEFDSDEYYKIRKQFDDICQLHYKRNRHHPEHFPNGINDMNLIDIIEMICDWKVASEHYGGNIDSSFIIQKTRLKMTIQLAQIIKNTIDLIH